LLPAARNECRYGTGESLRSGLSPRFNALPNPQIIKDVRGVNGKVHPVNTTFTAAFITSHLQPD